MSTTAQTPRKWWEVYTGDKECRLFRELARSEYEWRTTKGLVEKTKLQQKDVESIIAKYIPLGIIQQNPENPEKWRYWERASKTTKSGTISDEDKKKRIDEQIKAKSATP